MTAANRVIAGFGLAAAPFITSVALLLGTQAHADDTDVAQARSAFIDRMVTSHGFDRASLTASLGAATIDKTILDAMARPAERVAPWHEYRAIFVNDARIAAGVRFWTEHAATIDEIARRYGVAPEMLVAIVGVETYFGQRMGRYRVIDALATLAFAYPPRAKFFAGELEQFLLLSREEHLDVDAPMGSYAGAMGAGQFIPSSYRAYAVDANSDGKRDIWSDWEDTLGSVANYFKVHGWRAGEPVADPATRSSEWKGAEPTNGLDLDQTVGSLTKMGYVFTTQQSTDAPAAAFALEAKSGPEFWIGYHNFSVITRYNRSPKYALAAYELGQAIRAGYDAGRASAASDALAVAEADATANGSRAE
jgi:membrane-bound lytic murein transglycosylase B